jgi:hypothetical protein
MTGSGYNSKLFIFNNLTDPLTKPLPFWDSESTHGIEPGCAAFRELSS